MEVARWIPAGLPGAWLRAYALIWIAMLGGATLLALAGGWLTPRARHLLGLRLEPQGNPPPRVEHILALAAHNIPIATWPLLLGVLGAHRDRLATGLGDAVLLACILLNTLPVGVAVGAYGGPLLPYVPQLPLEFAGLALGASAWLVQRRRTLTVYEGLVWFALTAAVLLCAAVVETVAVPHR